MLEKIIRQHRFEAAVVMSIIIMITCIINQFGIARDMMAKNEAAKTLILIEIEGEEVLVEKIDGIIAKEASDGFVEIIDNISDIIEAIADLLTGAKFGNDAMKVKWNGSVLTAIENTFKFTTNNQRVESQFVQLVNKRLGNLSPGLFLFHSLFYFDTSMLFLSIGVQ